MIQLFKERTFGDIFSDTFGFFKQNGKHFFKQYLIINGGIIIVIAAICYVFFHLFKDAFFNSAANLPGDSVDAVLAANLGLLIVLTTVSGILMVVLSALNYSFPVAYLGLYETRGSAFSTKDVLREIWSKAGKIIIFVIGTIFIVLPVFALIGAFSVLLVFLIIGIPLLFLLFPAFTSWISLAFYEYLNTDSGYFNALSSSFRFLKYNFWKFTGATLFFYIMMQVVQAALTVIPYILTVVYAFSSEGEMKENLQLLIAVILFFAIFSFIVALILSNFILIGQGMMFYSCKEADDNVSTSSEIDNIGTHFE